MIPVFRFAVRTDLESKEDSDQFLPTKSDPEATGYDVRCAEPGGIKVLPLEFVKIRLGFRTFSPPGWWFELRPRSSSHVKKNLHCLYGVIDETYENELIFSCQYLPEIPFTIFNQGDGFNTLMKTLPLDIEYGERIGQIVPVKRQEMSVERVTNTEFDELCKKRASQRKGGLGSTGDK